MNEPDMELPVDMELPEVLPLGMALGADVVEFEEPDEGEAGACAKAGAANIVATRQAAICVLSIVNSFR
jgi:hypothetical protein